ncbi:hypothetical protein GW915_07380 [bacterium]|nr:hypothetical protein [bacterium]
MKLLLSTLSIFIGLNAMAIHEEDRAPLVASITQTAGYQHVPPNKKTAILTTIDVQADGAIYETITYTTRRGPVTETKYFGYYPENDIARFKNSISQLPLDRPLVETDEPILCDGGSTHFKVVIESTLTTLEESNDCSPNRARKDRSKLEVAVVQVLNELLSFYWENRR